MNRICNKRTVVTTLALLCAIASGTAVAKSTWTLDAKALMYPGADPVVELPSVDGSGWKMLHGNQATHQVSYATSGETLDPLFPIRIRYEFLSHSPSWADARLAGFQLMDARVVNTSIHRDGQGCAMEGDYLSVGFQWLVSFPHHVVVRSRSSRISWPCAVRDTNCSTNVLPRSPWPA